MFCSNCEFVNLINALQFTVVLYMQLPFLSVYYNRFSMCLKRACPHLYLCVLLSFSSTIPQHLIIYLKEKLRMPSKVTGAAVDSCLWTPGVRNVKLMLILDCVLSCKQCFAVFVLLICGQCNKCFVMCVHTQVNIKY